MFGVAVTMSVVGDAAISVGTIVGVRTVSVAGGRVIISGSLVGLAP